MSITQARRFLGERGYRTTQLQPAHVQAAQLFRQATTSLPTTLTVSNAIVETDSSMAQTVDTPLPGLNNTLDSANLSRDERLAYEALCSHLQSSTSSIVRDNIMAHNAGLHHFYNNDYLLFTPDVITG